LFTSRPLHDEAGDVFRYVPRPSFGNVEGKNLQRGTVLAAEDVIDRLPFRVGRLGLGVGSAQPAEVAEDEVDSIK
jgi:hypothetical protein